MGVVTDKRWLDQRVVGLHHEMADLHRHIDQEDWSMCEQDALALVRHARAIARAVAKW